MNKISIFLFPCLLLSSCTSANSYGGLIKKLTSYSNETIMHNSYSDGYYREEGFFPKDDGIYLYLESISSESENYIFIVLPNSTSVPNKYYCLFSWEDIDNSYSEAASFYISNSYNVNSVIYYDAYTGISDMIDYSQRLARAGINLILTVFDFWLDSKLNLSMEKVGMFPDFE